MWTVIPVKAEEPKPIRISRTVSTTSTEIGEKFTINYHITGDEIIVPRTKKEIAVIIDCSSSMLKAVDGSDPTPQNPSRISIAKSAAKAFISNFDDTYTKIFVLPYSFYTSYQNSISEFRSMNDTGSKAYFDTFINNIYVYGNTNTGDALRIAYNMLNTNGESDAKKYVVLLTDGEPTAYTYEDGTGMKVEAENYNSQYGIQKESCTDTGGGQDIYSITTGDYAVYKNVDFGKGVPQFVARMLNNNGNNYSVNFRLDNLNGTSIGTLNVGSTSSWRNYTCNLTGATGKHDVYVKFSVSGTYRSKDVLKVNWVQLINGDFYMGNGNVNNTSIKYYDARNSFDVYVKSQEYAVKWGATINSQNESPLNKKYNTFIIGFANNNSTLDSNLEEIGNAAGSDPVQSNLGKHYFKALTAAALTSAYNDIKDAISETLPFSLLSFSDILPVGIAIDPSVITTDSNSNQYLGNTNIMIWSAPYPDIGSPVRVQLGGPLESILKHIRSDAAGEVYKIDETNVSFDVIVLATTEGAKLFEKDVTQIAYAYVLPDDTLVSGTSKNGNEQNVTIHLRNANLSLPDMTILLDGSSATLTAAVVEPTINRVNAWIVDPVGNIELVDNNNNSAAITGKNIGNTTVTAKTTSTNGWYYPATASCNITVVDAKIHDMYILKGSTIPLNLDASNPLGLTLENYSVDTNHTGCIEIDKTAKTIKGLVTTGATPAELSVVVKLNEQVKTISCHIHVLDVEITPVTGINVVLWQDGAFHVNYDMPEVLNEKITLTHDFGSTNVGTFVKLSDTDTIDWKVRGNYLQNNATTTVTLTVTVSFEYLGVAPLQTKTIVRTITVLKPYIDIN